MYTAVTNKHFLGRERPRLDGDLGEVRFEQYCTNLANTSLLEFETEGNMHRVYRLCCAYQCLV